MTISTNSIGAATVAVVTGFFGVGSVGLNAPISTTERDISEFTATQNIELSPGYISSAKDYPPSFTGAFQINRNLGFSEIEGGALESDYRAPVREDTIELEIIGRERYRPFYDLDEIAEEL